ncbi:MAG TPA: YfiR family protein [Burkholderiaceae bacterium]
MSGGRRPGPSRRRVLRAVAAALGGLCLRARAQPPVRQEAVEAAYLHKLPGFVEWPAQAFASAASPIVVGVAGDSPVLEELARIAKGRLVVGRGVEAHAIDAPADVPRELHVLFIGADAARSARALVEAARARHALIVTDLPDGLADGAAVQFVQVDGRLRFEISLAGARRCGLKLSSQLMGVAWKVMEDGQ